jgi:ribosomal protein S18 acetylase RimI-like enzyme
MDVRHETVTGYPSGDAAPLAAFLAAYRQAFPDVRLMPAEFYAHHPALDGGRNLLVAWDDGGRLAGFAPLFLVPAPPEAPPDEPHTIWTVVLASPGLADGDGVRTLLLNAAVARGRELVTSLPPRPARLAAEVLASQVADLAFLLTRGFAPFDHVLLLEQVPHDGPILPPLPAGVSTRRSDLLRGDDQAAYLAAYSRCFPERPKTAGDLELLVSAPFWPMGAAIFAEDQAGQLLGSVLLYPDATRAGVTDDVFVVPERRGQGIARHLVAAGLAHFRAQGLGLARLEVRQSNRAALALYEALGYTRRDEQLLVSYSL